MLILILCVVALILGVIAVWQSPRNLAGWGVILLALVEILPKVGDLS